MTDSSNKKSKDKRYQLDSVLYNTNRITGSSTDFPGDEDAIDRLLLNTGFDEDNEDESANQWDAEIREPIFSAAAGNIVIPEIVETDEITQIIPSKPLIDDFSKVIDPGFEIASEPELIANENDPETTPIILDIEENLKQEKAIAILAAEAKKAKVLAYAALGVAITAVIGAAFLAITAYKAQAEITRLSDLVSLIEEDLTGFNEKHNSNASDRGDSTFEPLSQAPEVDAIEADPDRQILANTNLTVSGRTHESDKKRPRADPTPTPAKSGWFVNLVAFKQRNDAEKQASDFMTKGVRTEIVEVEVNQAIWYRLRVGGFINKEQAAAYAEKIRKPLQLTSIWLAGG